MSEIPGTFCILPFVEFTLNVNGAVKPCCAFDRFVEKDGRPMSVYEHRPEEIWNSDDLRETRRKMLLGEEVPACVHCTSIEAKGLRSIRSDMNDMWSQGSPLFAEPDETIDTLAARMTTSEYWAPAAKSVNLDVGNLCNLKCRMCNAHASSMIASDPVHSRWVKLPVAVARWKSRDLVVAPRPVLGVAQEGFHDLDRDCEEETLWSKGDSVISLMSAVEGCTSLLVRLVVEKAPAQVRLCFGGSVLLEERLEPGIIERSFELDEDGRKGREFTLSHSLAVAGGKRGKVGLTRLVLRRPEVARSGVAFSSLKEDKQWFQDIEFITKQILANPDAVRSIRLVGGEPMLIKECIEIMEYLVDKGVAKNILLTMSTNGTIVSDDWSRLAPKFKTVGMQISLDGVGRIGEYIRYPTKWEAVAENLQKIMSIEGVYCYANSTVQAYNVLHIVDLVRWCDEMKISFKYSMVTRPAHLDTSVLPKVVKDEAADRLRRFARRNDQEGAMPGAMVADRNASMLQLADAISKHSPDWTDQKLREFMIFTNDLDASREQKFCDVFPEFVELLKTAGYKWISDRRHSQV